MKDEFIFDAGRYVLGDIESIFQDPLELKKHLKAIPKSKKKVCDYNEELDFGYFKIKHENTERHIQDCIEINTLEVPSGIVLIVPEYVIGKRRLKNCRRIETASEFTLTHICEDDTLISCKIEGEPRPFLFYVTPFKVNNEKIS